MVLVFVATLGLGIGVALPSGAEVATAQLKPLSLRQEQWFADPLVWRFTGEGIESVMSNGHDIAIFEGVPRAKQAVVEALFTPTGAASNGWNVASVALVDDYKNYWHLALVQGPPEHNYRRSTELVEMRDGSWLAQRNLKEEFHEGGSATWQFNQTYRLRLAMDEGGVTGEIFDAAGKRLKRQHYVFSATAVTCGRPALRVGGLNGHFSALSAVHAQPLPEGGQATDFPPYSVAGGRGELVDRATGFFYVKQNSDGRWWAIDPTGHPVVLLGVDHITFNGHWCEQLGYAPYGRKNRAKYSAVEVWEEETLARLKQWGFNMLGAGCSANLKHRGLIHTEFLNVGSHIATLGDEYDITPNERRPCSAFPNVFHPHFTAYSQFVARRKCTLQKHDPWLFGYFIDNELAWWGRGQTDTGIFDAVMKKGSGHLAKLALRDFISERCGGNPAQLQRLWPGVCESFDDLLTLSSLPADTPMQRSTKRDFLRLVAERYFKITTEAIRQIDPNHLILGARFAGTRGADEVVWEVAGKYCDVVTFNYYPMVELDEEVVYTDWSSGRELANDNFTRYYNYAQRPLLLTEWSFPALDAGLPCLHGAGQRFQTQAERTKATKLFAQTMLALPYLLGYDYFMWVDEPELGLNAAFPEDSNYGLINEDGEPYELITTMFSEVQRDAAKWRMAALPVAKKVEHTPLPDAMRVAQAELERQGLTVTQAGAKLYYRCDGEHFEAGNGRLRLRGKIGANVMVQEILLDGAQNSFGTYNAMVQTVGDGESPSWTALRKLKKVEGAVRDGVVVVELEGEGQRDQMAFTIKHRLLLPPQTPWFIAEFLRLQNVGAEPLRLKSIFFRLHNDFTARPDRTPPNLWGAPVADCWVDPVGQRFLGAAAPVAADILINFYFNEHKGQHPDARREFSEVVTLPARESYTLSTPLYLYCVGGHGDSAAWQGELKKLPFGRRK